MSVYPMADAAPQIISALRAMDGNPTVTEQWPRQQPTAPTITVTEITNMSTAIQCVDELTYQIDIWCDAAVTLRTLAQQVDLTLAEIGFRRTYSGPAAYEVDGMRKTMRFGRKVDKRTLRLID